MNTAYPKLCGLLGMAKRAGKLSIGYDAAAACIKNNNGSTFLVAVDASAKTVKECRFLATSFNGTVLRLPIDKAAFATAIGMHKPVAVAALSDEGFVSAIRPHCSDNSEV